MINFQSYFSVRQATYNDIEAIHAITREAFEKYAEMSPNANPDALSETLKDIKNDIDTKTVLLAVRDNIPVGAVRVLMDKESKKAYLSRFAVKLSAQNNGIGKSLMNLVDEIMKKNGMDEISLHTDSTIAALIRFYYGRGFHVESVENSRGYPRAKLVKKYN